MKSFSAYDLYQLTKEIKEFENSRIDSFYSLNDLFYIKFYQKRKGHFFLATKLGQFLMLTTKKEDSQTPNPFIQTLRKYLKNTFISKIEQIPDERILKIELTRNEGEKQLIFYLFMEIFAPGNIVLTDENQKIINTFTKKTFKDRTIKNNEIYQLPPKKDISITTLDSNILKEKLKEEQMPIVKFLAIKFGLGGKYSEEILIRSNLDKNIISNEIKDLDIENLTKSIKSIYDIKPEGILYLNDDYSPIIMKSKKDEFEKYDTYALAVEKYYSKFLEKIDLKEKVFEDELKKLEKRLSKQKEQKEQILIDYEVLNNTGNIIYNNYAMLEELLNAINNAIKEKGIEYVKEKIKTDDKLKSIIKKFNSKTGEIEVEIN